MGAATKAGVSFCAARMRCAFCHCKFSLLFAARHCCAFVCGAQFVLYGECGQTQPVLEGTVYCFGFGTLLMLVLPHRL
jgi:hypothetical protein